MLDYYEVIWWLDNSYNVPMDIIRFILSEWISYPPIESNEKFRECLRLWFERDKDKQEVRNNMIKKYGHISDWNTKNITNMRGCFYDQYEFNEDLSRWDVSHVTDMRFMFDNCYKFHCDLSLWDVSQVTNMSLMFFNCYALHCDLSHWHVHNVTNMSLMFYSCISLNCDLSQWNVSQVQNMDHMFYGCKSFNCDLSQWKIHHICSYQQLFLRCDNLIYRHKIYRHWHKFDSFWYFLSYVCAKCMGY